MKRKFPSAYHKSFKRKTMTEAEIKLAAQDYSKKCDLTYSKENIAYAAFVKAATWASWTCNNYQSLTENYKSEIETLIECWNQRNPSHETNLDTGEDMFWKTLLMVIKDFNSKTKPNDQRAKTITIKSMQDSNWF